MARPIPLVMIVLLAALPACRPDAGSPDYSTQEDIIRASDVEPISLPGPDPWVPGQARLNIGIFYEGGASQTILINNDTVNYFIFTVPGTEQLTFAQFEDEDHIEGTKSDRIEHAGLGFWGGAVVWSEARDLSIWTVLHLSLKSSAAAFSEVDIGMTGGTNAAQKATDYGYVNDGQWHTLAIPLADFTEDGVDLSAITAPFGLGGLSGAAGESLLVDNVYFTAD